MLTFLVLIHYWFYSTPKLNSLKDNTSEVKNRKYLEVCANQQKSVSESESTSTRSSSHFYAHVSLVAVCKISTSILLPDTIEITKGSMSMDDKFRAAVRVIHSLPKDGPYQPSNSTKLKFYGLYKQATEGTNTTPKPGFWDVVSRAKWEAWTKLGDISKEEAMQQYVDCLKEIVETMSFNGDVEDFLDSIGPFYEFVTLQGNEYSHIKEKIEEVASSSGSSLNSLAPSAENSKEGSPVKIFCDNELEEIEDDEVSASETAEVIVETSTATYETKASKSSRNYSHQNGNAAILKNDECNNTPPPAPVHSYSQQNGFVKHVPSNEDDDEVLTVSTTPYGQCKEDLEHDVDDISTDHRKVRVTSSIETVASNATSGTESEKYYSGDSEPEFEEKYAASLAALNNEPYPSTSAGASQKAASTHTVTFNGFAAPRKPLNNNPPKKALKERVSPKISSTSLSPTINADILTQHTVERLNRDVDHILARLRILEAAYAANAEGVRGISNQNRPNRRRVFGDLSIQSIAFIVMWPFVVQFLLKLMRWWWRRRRNVARAMAQNRLS